MVFQMIEFIWALVSNKEISVRVGKTILQSLGNILGRLLSVMLFLVEKHFETGEKWSR